MKSQGLITQHSPLEQLRRRIFTISIGNLMGSLFLLLTTYQQQGELIGALIFVAVNFVILLMLPTLLSKINRARTLYILFAISTGVLAGIMAMSGWLLFQSEGIRDFSILAVLLLVASITSAVVVYNFSIKRTKLAVKNNLSPDKAHLTSLPDVYKLPDSIRWLINLIAVCITIITPLATQAFIQSLEPTLKTLSVAFVCVSLSSLIWFVVSINASLIIAIMQEEEANNQQLYL
jgi:hypothetical protein